jgi:hypothetical protein
MVRSASFHVAAFGFSLVIVAAAFAPLFNTAAAIVG